MRVNWEGIKFFCGVVGVIALFLSPTYLPHDLGWWLILSAALAMVVFDFDA